MGVNYLEVIERMKRTGQLKNESAVARALDITPQALSNYKKKGDMPSHLVVIFAEKFGVSVDWLITGEGEPFRQARRAAEETAAYHAQEEQAEAGSLGLSAEEAAYINRLLKVMRARDKSFSAAVRSAIDSFLSMEDERKQ